MFTYEILQIIWCGLLGIIIMAFMVMDGFDFGSTMLLPFATKNDLDRRIIVASIEPVWEANQVWLILTVGGLFAAWPYIYTVLFSGLYLLVFTVLACLILRPVAIKFRNKSEKVIWRQFWDFCLYGGAFIIAFSIGLLLGNIILGLQFHFSPIMQVIYTGSFKQLFTVIPMIFGCSVTAMLMCHGACYLNIKTTGDIQNKAINIIRTFALLTPIILIAGFYLFYYQGNFYEFSFTKNLTTDVLVKNISVYPVKECLNSKRLFCLVFPIALWVISYLSVFFTATKCSIAAFISSSLGIISIVVTFALIIYPVMLPSASSPQSSLTVFNASASNSALQIMLITALILLPIIFTYLFWTYRVLRGKITIA